MRFTLAVPVARTSNVTLTKGWTVAKLFALVLELEPLIVPFVDSLATTPSALGIILPVAVLL